MEMDENTNMEPRDKMARTMEMRCSTSDGDG